jgi:small subunit ribosomal protein S4
MRRAPIDKAAGPTIVARLIPKNVGLRTPSHVPAGEAGPAGPIGTTTINETDQSTMSKREGSKYKINRRLGVNLWGRSKSPLNRRDYGPGQHGQRRKKPSDFGTQLMAKQKLKGYYANIGERQFRRLYEEAARRRGDTGANLIELLERRLDAVVYRMKFVATPFAARQFVNHGHIRVNGKRVNIASYLVRDNDTIEVKDKSKQLAVVLEASKSTERDVPDYLNVDHDKMKGTFVRAPKLADVPYPVSMEPNLVVEFYSR